MYFTFLRVQNFPEHFKFPLKARNHTSHPHKIRHNIMSIFSGFETKSIYRRIILKQIYERKNPVPSDKSILI
jgi:hypothetical protein